MDKNLALRLPRRSVLALPLALAAQKPATLTAKIIEERIKAQLGIPWRTETVDGYITGGPDQVVTGIATVMFPTVDVLRQCAAKGLNFLVNHEPTFYNGKDDAKDVANSKIYLQKKAFIDEKGIVVFRLHDHFHARRPDGIFSGMVQAMGWAEHRSPDSPRQFVLPQTTLGALAADLKKKLGSSTVRVVGDAKMRVSKAALSPGYTSFPAIVRSLEQADVLVCGETREWEGVEYVRDANSLGIPKGLIVLGHVSSEDQGNAECARWLKTFITEIPVEHVLTAEPFFTL